jgi:hypothetical protein
MIKECIVLLRIQHLQQGACRVALVASAKLIDFCVSLTIGKYEGLSTINQNNGVRTLNRLQALNDLARHGTNVSSPVELCVKHTCWQMKFFGLLQHTYVL